MIEPARIKLALITVATRNVVETLSPEELFQAFTILREKSQIPDPDNPNLWTTEISGHTLWGILDEDAGPNGEDLFSILFLCSSKHKNSYVQSLNMVSPLLNSHFDRGFHAKYSTYFL